MNEEVVPLKNGYRHIDTAHAYRVEHGVGQAVKESGIPREEIWITSKLWPSEYGDADPAIDRMLERLGLDYIDLLYLHQPMGTGAAHGALWNGRLPPVRSGASA